VPACEQEIKQLFRDLHNDGAGRGKAAKGRTEQSLPPPQMGAERQKGERCAAGQERCGQVTEAAWMSEIEMRGSCRRAAGQNHLFCGS